MKIVHTSDWHLGQREFFDSTLANIARLCQIADERGADVMVVAGDIFHNRQHLPEATRRIVEILKPSIARGMHLLLVPGNHDDRAFLSMMRDLLEFEGKPQRIHIARTYEIIEIPDETLGAVQFCVMPYPTQEQYLKARGDVSDASEQHQSISATMDSFARHLRSKLDPDKRAVFVAHLTVDGVTTPSGHELEIWDDLRLGTDSLPDENCVAYIALGHIHQQYRIEGHPIPTWYCGSPDRTNLGERADKKGALWVEIPAQGPGQVERICLNDFSTPFYKFECTKDEIETLAQSYPRLDQAFVHCTVTGATEADRGQLRRQIQGLCRYLIEFDLEGVEIAPLPTGLAVGEDRAAFTLDFLRDRFDGEADWPAIETRARRLIDATFGG